MFSYSFQLLSFLETDACFICLYYIIQIFIQRVGWHVVICRQVQIRVYCSGAHIHLQRGVGVTHMLICRKGPCASHVCLYLCNLQHGTNSKV